MIKAITISIILTGLLPFAAIAGKQDVTHVYVVFYATSKGKTGHIGIAIDNYKIVYRETNAEGVVAEVPDTVSTGELTYYDVWPNDDYFSISNTGKDIPALYFKLPESSNQEITLNSLYDQGIPHREHYPSDGLLKIATHWQQDDAMKTLLDSMVNSQRLFNARKFNCSDFVRIPLEQLLGCNLQSREFVLTGWSTTPNKLYRNLRRLKQVEVIKNADEKATRSFIGQRVLYKIIHRS